MIGCFLSINLFEVAGSWRSENGADASEGNATAVSRWRNREDRGRCTSRMIHIHRVI